MSLAEINQIYKMLFVIGKLAEEGTLREDHQEDLDILASRLEELRSEIEEKLFELLESPGVNGELDNLQLSSLDRLKEKLREFWEKQLEIIDLLLDFIDSIDFQLLDQVKALIDESYLMDVEIREAFEEVDSDISNLSIEA